MGWLESWKLAENSAEITVTGGGPNNMQNISSKVDAVAKLCSLYTAFEGIKDVESFGTIKTGQMNQLK